MAETHWHHFVPETYLKGFLDPRKVAVRQNVLWVYGENRKIRPKGADRVAGEEGFNYTPETPGFENATEEAMSEMETAAGRIFGKIRAGQFALTAQQKSELALYIGVQKYRTRLFRETLNTGYIDGFRQDCAAMISEKRVPEIVARLQAERGSPVPLTIEETEAFIRSTADGSTSLSQTSKYWTIDAAFDGGKRLAVMLNRMRWELLQAPASEAFITSDNPVMLFEPVRIPGPKSWIYSLGLQLLFPISPQFLLFGDFASGADGKVRVETSTVRTMNESALEHAHLEVYASFYSMGMRDRLKTVFKAREPIIPRMPPDYVPRNGAANAP